MVAARRKASIVSCSDASKQLYIIFHGATGIVHIEADLAILQSLITLFERDKKYVNEYHYVLKASDRFRNKDLST